MIDDIEYGLLRRDVIKPTHLKTLQPWDLLISAYNQSERVIAAFDEIPAVIKHWIIHPEYDFSAASIPTNGFVHHATARDEADFWHEYFGAAGADEWCQSMRICLDITGFMRPHLMLALHLLRVRGFSRIWMIYSDPISYSKGAHTPFTKGAVTSVRQVRGFEGSHDHDAGPRDLLVLGAGYDDELIRRVADAKRAARKIEMFGLPSLQPHMYEENRFRAARADESVGSLSEREYMFAPANDPFATAQELHARVTEEEKGRGLVNLYLSPLATKPQALGFAIYFLTERVGTATSVVFPYAEYYSQETSIGWSRTSIYELELDWFKI